jgi:tetratricopeptide (TPR) repeat protein
MIPIFDYALTDSQHNYGKLCLYNGQNEKAIEVFDKLINENKQFENIKEAKTLLGTSYNNRGVAKCANARINLDVNLYKDGMSDFEKSIEISQPNDDVEKACLVAFSNLSLAKAEFSQLFKSE